MSTMEQVRSGSGEESGGIGRWWNNGRTFLTEVRNEMRRVTWPSRREVYATTIVVLLVSAFFGLYFWIIDLVLAAGVNFVFRWFGAA